MVIPLIGPFKWCDNRKPGGTRADLLKRRCK
jgi:hypothetical protein